MNSTMTILEVMPGRKPERKVIPHTLAAMQAVDLAGKDDFAPFTKKVHDEVRKISAFVEDDRELDKDATALAQWLKETELLHKI